MGFYGKSQYIQFMIYFMNDDLKMSQNVNIIEQNFK